MAKSRLFIDEITSVGAVAEGDNPESEIIFWKKREPAATAPLSETTHAIYKRLMREHLAAKETGMPTIKEQILEMVGREAERKFNFGFGRDNYGYSIEKARAELWQSPTGKILADLQRSAVADMTLAEAKAQIRKDKAADSEAFAKAFEALERGFPH